MLRQGIDRPVMARRVRVPPYELTGSGEPLLLLSGYAVPASSLDAVKAPFADRYTVITFEYPGSGTAPSPVLPLTIPGLAACAVRLLDLLGLESANVYGMSMGGLVAQEIAIRFPERVRGLVLGATTAGGFRAPRPDLRTLWSGISSVGTQVDGAQGVRLSGIVYQGYAAALHDTSSGLDRIQAKTLIIHGEHDPLVPVRNARLLHDGIPGSSLVVLPRGSHLYAFDDPVGSAGVVLDWLEESAPVAAGRSSWVHRTVEPWERAVALQIGLTRVSVTAGRMALAGLKKMPGRPGRTVGRLLPCDSRGGTARCRELISRLPTRLVG